MKAVYWFILLCVLSCQSIRHSTLDVSQNDRPNIIFILSDDQRHDALGGAGHPIIQTPHIDALAAKGIRFAHAFVTTPICAASRATILTGLTERSHEFTFGMDPLSHAEMSISYPKILKDQGYHTGFFGKFGVKMKVKPNYLFDTHHIQSRPFLSENGHIDELNTREALAFIENSPQNQPFCLSISYSSAHADDEDHIPGEEHHFPVIESMKGKYAEIEVPLPTLNDPKIFENHPDFLKESLNRVRWFWRWDTPEKYKVNLKAYYGMISSIDHLVGSLVSKLKEKQLADNTLIIYMGDNGYYMGERGFAGKWSHYDESVRVPLIIYDPRSPLSHQNQLINELVLNLDIAPTILDIAGIDIPNEYQGQSLLPFVQGKSIADWRQSFFMEHLMVHPQIPRWEGVRTKDHVYARYIDQDPAYEFLHDLKKDPLQLENLSNQDHYKLQLQELQKLTDSYLEKYSD